MIEINHAEVRAYRQQMQALLAAEYAQFNQRYQQLLSFIFTDLVKGTPQWSGDLAANWNFSIGTPDESYRETPMKYAAAALHSRFEPKQMGDPEAVAISLARMAAVIDKVTWRDRVHFTNATPIAEDVENQTVYIRPVNLVGGAPAMISHIEYKYGTLGL